MYSGEFLSGRVTYEIGRNLLMEQGKGRRHEAAPKGLGPVISVVTKLLSKKSSFSFPGRRGAGSCFAK